MARRRSRQLHPAVVVIGMLHLLGACFGLCCLTFYAAGLEEHLKEAQREQLQQQNPGAILVFEEDFHPELRTIENVQLVVNAAFTLMVLVAGIGLLLRHNWARWLSIIFAALSVPAKIGYGVLVFTYNVPAWENHINPDEVAGHLLGTLFVLVLGLAYAVAVLIVMFLPSVARSFRRERVPPAYLFEDDFDADDDYDEEDYPRFRRGR
jgi:hypothetical protein